MCFSSVTGWHQIILHNIRKKLTLVGHWIVLYIFIPPPSPPPTPEIVKVKMQMAQVEEAGGRRRLQYQEAGWVDFCLPLRTTAPAPV